MSEIWNKKCLISPSLISCLDMCNLETQIRLLEEVQIPILHVDILDGHFSPSMPLGLDTVRQLKQKTKIPFDVHVMTTNNEYFIEELIDMQVEQIIFHLETESHPDAMLNRIHSAGIRAGIALKPGTPLTEIGYLIEKCDAILLMLINPGYASSSSETQVIYADSKIRDLRKLITSKKLNTIIELDGRISIDNLRNYGKDTAQIFVAGSTMLDRNTLKSSIEKVKEIRERILAQDI